MTVDPIDKLNAALAEAEDCFANRFSGLAQHVELEPFEGCRLWWCNISQRWGLHIEQKHRDGNIDTKPLGSVSVEKRAAAAAALHFLWERLADAQRRNVVDEALREAAAFTSARKRESEQLAQGSRARSEHLIAGVACPACSRRGPFVCTVCWHGAVGSTCPACGRDGAVVYKK